MTKRNDKARVLAALDDTTFYDPAHDCRDYGSYDNEPQDCRMCMAFYLRLEREVDEALAEQEKKRTGE